MNSVSIIGTMTRDVELKYLPSGLAVGSFAIAVNQDYKKQDGTKVEKTSFFDVKSMGKQSEIVSQYFSKGSRIAINGELEQESWTAQDGGNRSKVVIKLINFSFIDRKSDSQPKQQSYNQNPPVVHENRNSYPPQNIPEIDINLDEVPF